MEKEQLINYFQTITNIALYVRDIAPNYNCSLGTDENFYSKLLSPPSSSILKSDDSGVVIIELYKLIIPEFLYTPLRIWSIFDDLSYENGAITKLYIHLKEKFNLIINRLPNGFTLAAFSNDVNGNPLPLPASSNIYDSHIKIISYEQNQDIWKIIQPVIENTIQHSDHWLETHSEPIPAEYMFTGLCLLGTAIYYYAFE